MGDVRPMVRRDGSDLGGALPLSWSDINKTRFYGIGTALYSALNVILHPITVIKTRQQVLSSKNSLHQPSLGLTIQGALEGSSGFDKVRGLYRGLGVVLSVAVPARALYVGVLESSREGVCSTVNELLVEAYFGPDEAHTMLPLVATIGGGVAGGLAAVSAQILVVPMDVISQRQMIMDAKTYERQGSALSVFRSVWTAEGMKGLYRGFGLSIFSSLPTGSIWWATYGGCQHKTATFALLRDGEERGSVSQLLRRGLVQLLSGLSAAVVASVFTQPLDVVKTRLQVGSNNVAITANDGLAVSKDLLDTSGYRGFFRGTGPRIMHMGLWGTLLSSAYEFLRHIARK